MLCSFGYHRKGFGIIRKYIFRNPRLIYDLINHSLNDGGPVETVSQHINLVCISLGTFLVLLAVCCSRNRDRS